jgi:hypothetical protein
VGHSLPLIREEDTIDALQCGVFPLIAPRKQSPIELSFLEGSCVQEVVKLAHQAVVDMVIVFILSMIDHVEITTPQPWTGSNLMQCMQLNEE